MRSSSPSRRMRGSGGDRSKTASPPPRRNRGTSLRRPPAARQASNASRMAPPATRSITGGGSSAFSGSGSSMAAAAIETACPRAWIRGPRTGAEFGTSRASQSCTGGLPACIDCGSVVGSSNRSAGGGASQSLAAARRRAAASAAACARAALRSPEASSATACNLSAVWRQQGTLLDSTRSGSHSGQRRNDHATRVTCAQPSGSRVRMAVKSMAAGSTQSQAFFAAGVAAKADGVGD
mmetsp:Transcript_96039/g.213849  ORF Transcript_96039/g.213849 Transcript_96039/m.213849 type:complete len:237 (+) Transcript_96039:674-1384(+)